MNGKHNSAFECGKTCAVRWKNLPHGNAGHSATSERFWSVGQSNSFATLEARRNYLVGKFPRLGSRMGITDAPRSSRDSDERPKESAKRARLSRPRGTKSEALVLVEGLDSDSHRRGFSRVGDYAMRAMARPVKAIIKRLAPRDSSDPREIYIAAMFLLWASRPSKETSEPDGSYFIGDVGEAPKKNWERLNPYAVATPK